MKTLSRNAQVLKAICERRPDLGITKLLKLAYLADLEARKLLGHPISEFQYIRYHHGPFDTDVYNAVGELEAHGHVSRYEANYRPGYHKHGVRNKPTTFGHGLSPAEVEIIDYVVKSYGPMPLNTLLDKVYATEPMRAVERFEQSLPMHVVDNAEKDEIGVDLEEIIARERRIEQGHYILGPDLFNGLRTQIRRRG